MAWKSNSRHMWQCGCFFTRMLRKESQTLPGPGSSASCPPSAEGHRQESTGLLAPKSPVHWADRVHARPTPPLLESLWCRSPFCYYPLLLLTKSRGFSKQCPETQQIKYIGLQKKPSLLKLSHQNIFKCMRKKNTKFRKLEMCVHTFLSVH